VNESDPLYEVVVSCEWDAPMFAVSGTAFDVLSDAGAREYDVSITDVEFVVRASAADEETIRAALVETLSDAGDGHLMGFAESPAEAGFDIESINRIDCEYGCGRPATIRNAPMVVNGRLYSGHLCRGCHQQPRDLQNAFEEGSSPYEELATLQTAYDNLHE